MNNDVDVHLRHAQLRAEFVRNIPFQALADQFDRQLQRRRAVQSLELAEEARGIAVVGAPGTRQSHRLRRLPREADEHVVDRAVVAYMTSHHQWPRHMM